GMMSELDRRRHETFDLHLQFKRHRSTLAAVGVVAVVVAFGGSGRGAPAQRRRGEPVRRLASLVHVLLLAAREPQRLERAMQGTPQPGSIIATTLGRVASAVGKRAI